jgi:hypothetical protein
MAARWLGLIAPGVGLLGLGAGFVVLSNVIGSNTAPVADNDGPLCDSAAVSAAAKSAIENAPVAKSMHVRALEFRGVRELQYDAIAKKRSCSAVAILNSGEQALNYSAEWTNDRPPHVWVQIDYQK